MNNMSDNQNQVTVRELRQFGCGLGIILLAIGVTLLWQGAMLGAVVIIVALAVAHVFWWQWPGTRRAYSRWMAVAQCISKVMTTLLLLLLYFLILTPLALLARLFGKHFLDLGFREDCESYWVVRNRDEQRHNCEKQY
jgi:hypothetical protein